MVGNPNWGKDLDLEYRLQTLGRFRAWQDSFEGNLNGSNSLGFDVYIDPARVSRGVEVFLLRFKLKPFEYYVSYAGDIQNGPWEFETNGANWDTSYESFVYMSDAGGHNHGGAVVDDGDHGHLLNRHTHHGEIPAHEHKVFPGIKYDTAPKDVRIHVNGVDRTTELGGPFNADRDSLDLTQYITPTGWNEIRFYSNQPGRIFSTYYIELHMR